MSTYQSSNDPTDGTTHPPGGHTPLDATKADLLRMRSRLKVSSPEQAKRMHPAFWARLPETTPLSASRNRAARPSTRNRPIPAPEPYRPLSGLVESTLAGSPQEAAPSPANGAPRSIQVEQPRIKPMAPTLTTRLGRDHVLISRVPTGAGPTVWVGEFRRQDGSRHPHGHPLTELRIAPDLGDLLRALQRLSEHVAAGQPLTSAPTSQAVQRAPGASQRVIWPTGPAA